MHCAIITIIRTTPRGGNWQAYLVRSDDFVRFCCHMAFPETLVAQAVPVSFSGVGACQKSDKEKTRAA